MSRRKKRKLKSKLRLALFLVLLVGIFTGGFAMANSVLWPWLTGESITGGAGGGEDDLAKLSGLNVLMMGVDERSGDKSLRTDTMILANINNKDNRISLLSIPRDTKVIIPGHGTNKINAANIYGGPEMAMDMVTDLTGVPVDYYVITNFNGFKDIVDALGGVTVDVEKDMHYNENAYGGAYSINLNKGVQRLDGNQALQYARFRHDALGDITRTQRQLKLLTAIGDEVMKPESITKLPKLVPQVYKNVETNMGLKQMVSLAKAARNLDNVQMVSQTLPGWFLNERGVSYWYVDPQKAREVATALFEEGKVVEVVQGEISPTSQSSGTQVAMKQPVAAPAPVVTSPPAKDNPREDTGDQTEPADPSGGTPDNGGAAGTSPGGAVQPEPTADPEQPGPSTQDGTRTGTPGQNNHVEININTFP